MKTKPKQVYQFKIWLDEIEPRIWRQIQVPETYTFWDLHVAMQDSMGWLDYHLHQFEIINPLLNKKELIGIPYEELDEGPPTLAGWNIPIKNYFSFRNKKADYLYDFGDSWEHSIYLENILPKDPAIKYPICVGGERTCPPEDCGGTSGFENFLEIMSDPSHEEYQSMVEWYGKVFDAEEFNPRKVKFDNPKKRWKIAFRDH